MMIRTTILSLAALLALAMVLFPPWVRYIREPVPDYPDQKWFTPKRDYAPIWSPPDEGVELRIDFGRLGVQLLGAVILAALAFAFPKPSGGSSGSLRQRLKRLDGSLDKRGDDDLRKGPKGDD